MANFGVSWGLRSTSYVGVSAVATSTAGRELGADGKRGVSCLGSGLDKENVLSRPVFT